MTAARALGVEAVDGAALERGDGVLDEADSFSVSVWIITCTSCSSATEAAVDRGGSGAPVLVQLERAGAGADLLDQRRGREALPLPGKPMLMGSASQACSIRAMCQGPGVQVVAAVPVAGPVPPPIKVVTPDISASSTCCGQMKWIWASMPPAVRILPSPAMISVPGPMTMVDAGLDVGVAGLADGGDAAVLDADIGLHDPPVVDDHARW